VVPDFKDNFLMMAWRIEGNLVDLVSKLLVSGVIQLVNLTKGNQP